jgi:hypothetical protein
LTTSVINEPPQAPWRRASGPCGPRCSRDSPA